MPKRKFTAEQIVTKLRQIEVLLAQGKTIAVACKEVGTTDKSYYRWRNSPTLGPFMEVRKERPLPATQSESSFGFHSFDEKLTEDTRPQLQCSPKLLCYRPAFGDA